MKINEVTKRKGTYAGVHFTEDTVKALKEFCKEHSVPNSVKPDSFHTTVLYSRKYCPDYEPIKKYPTPLIAKFTGWDVWKTHPDSNPRTDCLILKFDCPELEKRHKELMKDLGATYDYDEYKTHLTLSYNIGDDFNVEELPDFAHDIEIVGEYEEDLNLDWAADKK